MMLKNDLMRLERKRRFDELADSGKLEILSLEETRKIIGIEENLTQKEIREEISFAYNNPYLRRYYPL